MRTVPLGEAGVEVSALCLGCMFFGTRVDGETSIGLLVAVFIAECVLCFDNADPAAT